MRRIQFIELHEQSWFPKFLRDDITDTLQFALSNTAAYGSIAPLFQHALEDAKRHSIVDLCSGAGTEIDDRMALGVLERVLKQWSDRSVGRGVAECELERVGDVVAQEFREP